MAKKTSKQPMARQRSTSTKKIHSSVSRPQQSSMDSFALKPHAEDELNLSPNNPLGSRNNGFQNIPDFAREGGRRGAEVLGLSGGPSSTSLVNLTVARRRSRYATLTNPYAKRALDIWVSNVVGQGHKMVSMAPDVAFKKQVEALWNKWCSVSDTTFHLPYGGVEALAFRAMAEGGDCFIRMRMRYPSDGLPVPLQLQLLESEQVPVVLNTIIGNEKVIGGIQVNILGEPVFYHMYKDHPGEFIYPFTTNSIVPIPVPAEFVLHLHEVRRPGQMRGMPILSNVIIALSDLDRYLDAELVRKKCAALIGGFIKAPAGGGDENPFVSSENPDAAEIEAMEPGTYPVLPPGYDVTFSEPADVGGNFEAFLRQELRMIAAGLNLTYEQLTGDLLNANDRTIRATMLEFKRIVAQYQSNILVHQMHMPIFKKWFDLAIISGALTIPYGMDEEDARKVKWIPDPWDYMNPTQEIGAQKDKIRCGLGARSDILMAAGEIPEEVDMRIAADKARADKLGLVFDTDPAEVAKSGVEQPSQVPPPPEEKTPAQENGIKK